MALRVVFMGTPDFSVPALAAILEAGHTVAAVYTQPPRPAGRGMDLRKSAVHAFAEGRGLTVLTPRSLKGADERSAFAAHRADIAVVVAYGLLLPKPVLDAPRCGCLNLHASALPRWRGAAPIQRAIMAGDTETAMMVMRMEEGLDTGPVCLAERVAIGPDTSAGELHDALSALGGRLIGAALEKAEAGQLACIPQPSEGVTYAAKIGKDEGRIAFDRPAAEVHNLIRGLSPTPGAWLEAGPEGRRERIKVTASQIAAGLAGAAPGTVLDDRLAVACGSGAIRLLTVQRAGKRPVSAVELLRGFALPEGTRLS